MARRNGSKLRRAGAAAAATPSAVDQLKNALTDTLKDNVAETVEAVCRDFEQAVASAAAKAEGSNVSGEAMGYDMYYDCCQRLVAYIDRNMDTSPDFVQQMDRIILACHSNASESILGSVVTKDLWFRRRGSDGHSRGDDSSDKKGGGLSSSSSGSNGGRRMSTRSGRSSERKSSNGAMKKMETRTSVSRSPPATRTRSSRASPASHTRSHDHGESATGKRMATRTSSRSMPSKRPRRSAARVVLPIQTSEDEEEEKEEEEAGEQEEEEEEDDVVKPTRHGRRAARKSTQPHYDPKADDVLTFQDAIGDMCYPEKRSKAQTRFFKDRLRKSIQFVDALLCKPPPGKTCARGCKKIRAQMCSSSTPCKNKMCRIWHDVEAHTDRCQNTQCEFKNRILLRETMHKMELKKVQLAEAKLELGRKRAKLAAAAKNDDTDGDKAVETSLLQNEIEQLVHDLQEGEEELGLLEATKKTFWAILNDIGIELRDDVKDQFPDFTTHYEDKKTAASKARLTTPHEPTVRPATMTRPSPASRRSQRAGRRQSAGPHGDADDYEDEEDADDADEESNGDVVASSRRPKRRSLGSNPHRQGGPHDESDEETKGTDEEPAAQQAKDQSQEGSAYPSHYEYEGEAHDGEEQGSPPQPEIPALSGAALPYRQNPELDRAYAEGYTVTPVASNPETPAVAMEEDLGEQQQSREYPQQPQSPGAIEPANTEISGVMEGLSSSPPPPEELPVNNSGFTIRGNQSREQ